MTITYNLDIPDAPNNPSNDQPKMKINTNAIDSWTAVDHVKFDSDPAGTHKKVTYSSKNPAGAQVDPQSTLYTNNGTEFAAIANLFYRNASGTFPISIVRAFGSFTMTALSTTIINGANFTVAVNATGLIATVTLTAGVTTGTNFIVMGTYNTPGIANNIFKYTIAAGVVTFTVLVPNGVLSFQVLQI